MAASRHNSALSRASTLVTPENSTSEDCIACPDTRLWTKKGKKKIEGHLRPSAFQSGGPGDGQLVIIIAKADAVRECSACRSYFTKSFRIPEFWWTPWCRRSNGYFGAEKTLDPNGSLESYQTWFRFLIKQVFDSSRTRKGRASYVWYKLNIFTHWNARTQRTTIIIFDPRPELESRLLEFLMEAFPPCNANHPYHSHQYFLQELARLQDEAVWSIRNLVRETEIRRSSQQAREKANYFNLHDVARHAIHVSETLEVAITVVESMAQELNDFFAEYPTSNLPDRVSLNQSHAYFHFLKNKLRSLLARSNANKDRLHNEMQLSFNILSLFKAETSIKIEQAAQTDSATLKTIGFLTMAFLPASFVSALFSMSFFGFNQDLDKWAMSKDVWIYWVIAGPVTGVSFIAWRYWHRLILTDTMITEIYKEHE